MIACIKKLAKIIQEEKVDIVHARSRIPAWIAFFASRKTKTAFITTCHGYYGTHFFSRIMSWSKLVITPSEVIGRHMIDDFGVLPDNVRIIPRSVDLKKFNISRDPYRSRIQYTITIIGRITPLKGHIYFIKAMAKVIRTIPNVKIWIIGDAPAKKEAYREELQVLVKRLGLGDYVEFLGNRRDIPQLLAHTDVLVLSTITEEAFGRVILEAQAAGVPVVATKVGGVIEIIDDGKTGLLVLPKDTDEMARAVIRLLKDKILVQNLTVEAKKKLEGKFTLDHMASQTIKVYEELLKSRNILVIKMGSIGDVVLITASLKALRQKFPDAKIFCAVGKESREILQRCPYIDELIVFDYKGKDRGLGGLIRLAGKLRQHHIDTVIDFQNNRKSHLLSFLCWPLESYGYDNGKWSLLLSNRIKDNAGPMPPVNHQFQLLRMLGIEMNEGSRLELWPSREDDIYAQGLLDSEWLGNTVNIVGINMAASEKWATKNWPLKHLGRLCDLLSAKNVRVLITGTEKDRPAAHELLNLTKSKPALFIGKTDILQLAALIKRCRVLLTADSAPMHIAAAVGTPFVALFGPTDHVRHLPPAKQFRVIRKDLPCSPCYSPRCKIATHDCMKQISPEQVLSEIEMFLELPK